MMASALTAGSELRRPLGIAIVGGLLVSQWLTIYTTPAIYFYLDRLAHWLGDSVSGQPAKCRPRPTIATSAKRRDAPAG